MNETLLELSRLQFALTAMYHFIFVPLTLGMTFMLAIMESVYVLTGKTIYRDMTKFWGKLFAINFAIGVATGITMEFQFGMNWSYYSHYVGDIFGAPLAIEGLMAFFLESTFIGMFFFGWDRMSKVKHLISTWLVALGSNFSALWILIANGWMQNPEGSHFNPETMRMEMSSFADLIFNPVAQVKFVHTVSAGYCTGAMFVLAISSWYLLNKKHVAFARRSFAIAASFGMASVLSVIILGDESGYELGDVQKVKLAAIEAEWETEEPPAAFTLFGLPNQETESTDFAIKIPYVMGIIATRSIDEPVIGLKDLKAENKDKIRQGAIAHNLLDKMQKEGLTPEEQKVFDENVEHLGYGLLLKNFAQDMNNPTDEEIKAAADYSIPKVWPVYWGFRIMVACGFMMLLVFGLSLWYSSKHQIDKPRWLLKLAFFAMPLPWIACEAGWFIAEYGRQPWAIAEILPVHTAVSNLAISDVVISLIGITVLYTAFFIIGFYLMRKFARKGPEDHTPVSGNGRLQGVES